MTVRGLSIEALRLLASELCRSATSELASGRPLVASALVDRAASMLERIRSQVAIQIESPILIIEDDPETREEIRDLLLEDGFLVHCFANGREALEHLHTSPEAALILLDMEMPVMDGRSFQRELRNHEHLAEIPIIVVTGTSHELTGANVLTKPLGPLELRAAIDQVVVGLLPPAAQPSD
jgi:CheY-like chemotaxis protein